ncbi:MAG: MBL fold metallo-hydrolase [Clostridia bacterium]|nr:MBL fold metallo-hydrolase [Clostridia bacterium]
MKLTFLGAAHEVTGSCTLLEAAGHNVVIDCGMEQGQDLFENQELPVAPSMIDAVLVTHAHIDHSGLVPMLYAKGFRGPVFVTRATGRLCNIMLRDSAHIQEFEAEWRNRKAKRAGQAPYEPVYTMEDVQGVLEQFIPCEYDKETPILDGITAQFTDAGHLLGSSSITLTVTESGETRRLVFSGDIGNINKPILRDPQSPPAADYVIMESTYGDRSHGAEKPDYVKELAEIIQRTFDRGGNVVIPAFAVGRTQELLYFIRQIKEQGLVTGHGEFPVVIDSPLAIEATKIFSTDVSECYDAETLALLNKGVNPITFPGLRVSVTAEDSKLINADKESKVIISASGMCEAGRIRHHLKHNLWRPESTILFVGYQSVNTVGWLLLQGAATVKLFGEEIEVNAEIAQMHSVSGHADDNGLLRWAAAFEPKPTRVFVNHGDEGACETLAQRLRDEQGLQAEAPYSGDAWELLSDTQVEQGSRKRLTAKKRAGSQRGTTVYERLLAMLARLTRLVQSFEGCANKDIAKLTSQIQSVCEKWEK